MVALTVLAYAYAVPASTIPSPQVTAALTTPAFVYLTVFIAAMVAISADLLRYSGTIAKALRKKGMVPLSPQSLVPYVLAQGRYRKAFGASALLYGIFYSFLTSIVSYRPDLDFAAFPGLSIPSAQPVQLIGAPLYVPEVSIFLTNHVALALFAYDSRAKTGGGSWGGQLGAIIGLFTGCPTCAGLYFFSLVGGTGAVSFAVALSYYQPLFVLLSIPILLVSPYLISRSLSRVFRDGCVVVPATHHRP